MTKIRNEIMQIINRNCFEGERKRVDELISKLCNEAYNQGWQACNEKRDGLRPTNGALDPTREHTKNE